MFSQKTHRFIFLFGVLALAFGMMIGTVPTSVPQLILFGNWLLEGGFRRKWGMLKNNFLFWTLSTAYLIHVAGVFYSNDLGAGLHDIRTKMPLMALPLIFLSSAPLSSKELKWVVYCFITGCFFNTAWCHVYSFLLHKNEVVRSASRFMSHIRLGLYLNMAIAACVYLFPRAESRNLKILFACLPFYFLVSMVFLGLASGLANFIVLGIIFALTLLFRKRKVYQLAGLVGALVIGAAAFWYMKDVAETQLAVKNAPQNKVHPYNAMGEIFVQLDTAGGQKENGYYVLINILPDELRRAWGRDFPADTFRFVPVHNIERFEVLVRYMASKGLYKDSVGYARLSAEDKENIKRGYTNYLQPRWNFLRRRTYELVNEYDEFSNGRSVNGHSFTMRLYFWKAAAHAIALHPVFGVGSGDVKQALDRSYNVTGSPLAKEWRIRPHNQFITVTVALGVVGLVLFLFSVFAPPLVLRKNLHALYWSFLLLAVISFMFEDTLETQAGLTFYAFFNTVFLCEAWYTRQSVVAETV